MVYFIDARINLTALTMRWHHNAMGIRQDLIDAGLLFAEANQFAMFAVYGFHGPRETRTLTHANTMRLGVHWDLYHPH